MVNNSVLITVAANACCLCNWAIVYQMVASYKAGQAYSAVKMKFSNCTQTNQFGQCFFTGHSTNKFISECIVTWKFVKEHQSLRRCSRVMAVNFPERCWWECCSDVTLKDVWRKDIWGTTDITWHHPTSQLVSDFSEGCENILYQVKSTREVVEKKEALFFNRK